MSIIGSNLWESAHDAISAGHNLITIVKIALGCKLTNTKRESQRGLEIATGQYQSFSLVENQAGNGL